MPVLQVEERPVVGGRLDSGVARQHPRRARVARLPECRDAVRHLRIGRERLQPWPDQHHAQVVVGLVHMDAGLGAEGVRGDVRQPIDEPALRK